MKEQSLNNLVRKYFSFLIIDYKFQFMNDQNNDESKDSPVFLQSSEFRIRVYVDRGFVSIDVGTLDAPDFYTSSVQWELGSLIRWYPISLVISYLKQQTDPTNQNEEFSKFTHEWWNDLEKQLKEYSLIIKPHWPKIMCFFKRKEFNENQKGLDEFIYKRAQAFIEEHENKG
jgi:hypothetical protein